MGTVPTPATAVAGTPANASDANTWRDGVNWVQSNHPLFIGTNSANQSIPNNSSTAITLNTEEIDSDSTHSTATNTSRCTPQTPGYHDIFAYCNFAANATGLRQLEVKFNGTTSLSLDSKPTVGSGAATHCNVSTKANFNGSTDYVEMYAFQTSGTGINVAAGARLCVEWRRTA